MNLQTALRQATDILTEAGTPDARLTAELLLTHTVSREKVFLYSHPEYELTPIEWLHFGRALYRRMNGVPAQHITGAQEFYGRPFRVSPDVLIPRPETEHVVEQALEAVPAARSILDIGTGSGALAITLSLELNAPAVATDLSFKALLLARRNAASLHARVEFLNCDLATPLNSRFDLIVSNPPYIPAHEIPTLQREVRDHEPHLALLGGPEGTELYPRIIAQSERLLAPGGWLVFEIGYQGEAAVRAAFPPAWSALATSHDLAGWPRTVRARFTP